MNLQQLRQKQHRFLREWNTYEQIEIEAKLRRFKNDFPISKLELLHLDEYIYGKYRENQQMTFCYWMEKELSAFGRIAGSPCFQYGVWYGTHGEDTEIRYRNTRKYGTTVEEALKNMLRNIKQLVLAGASNDYQAIAGNKIANKFKGKILACYYPERYLSIYADDYLRDILRYFNLDTDKSYKEPPIFLQQRLLNWKRGDGKMQNWSMIQFAIFINREMNAYYADEKDKEEDEEYIVPKFPELGLISPRFIDDPIDEKFFAKKDKESTPHKKAKVDYVAKSVRDSAIGRRGEQIVREWERNKLKAFPLLQAKVEWVSENSDGHGYDIQSVELDGTPMQIEVKSSMTPLGDETNFFLTAFEKAMASHFANYYVYHVSNVASQTPVIWAIKNPFKESQKGVVLSPVIYKVGIKRRHS